jgi:uncharacterized protein YbaA (DUF1428 family)
MSGSLKTLKFQSVTDFKRNLKTKENQAVIFQGKSAGCVYEKPGRDIKG